MCLSFSVHIAWRVLLFFLHNKKSLRLSVYRLWSILMMKKGGLSLSLSLSLSLKKQKEIPGTAEEALLNSYLFLLQISQKKYINCVPGEKRKRIIHNFLRISRNFFSEISLFFAKNVFYFEEMTEKDKNERERARWEKQGWWWRLRSRFSRRSLFGRDPSENLFSILRKNIPRDEIEFEMNDDDNETGDENPAMRKKPSSWRT